MWAWPPWRCRRRHDARSSTFCIALYIEIIMLLHAMLLVEAARRRRLSEMLGHSLSSGGGALSRHRGDVWLFICSHSSCALRRHERAAHVWLHLPDDVRRRYASIASIIAYHYCALRIGSKATPRCFYWRRRHQATDSPIDLYQRACGHQLVWLASRLKCRVFSSSPAMSVTIYFTGNGVFDCGGGATLKRLSVNTVRLSRV